MRTAMGFEWGAQASWIREEAAYEAIGLDRLVKQAAGMLDAREAVLVVRDPAEDDGVIVAAAVGVAANMVGSRLRGISDSMLERGELTVPIVPVEAAAAVSEGGPRGVLVVGGGPPSIGTALQAVLGRIAQLAGAVLSHMRLPAQMARRLRDEAKSLSVAMDARAGYTVPLRAETELARDLSLALGLDPATLLEALLATELRSAGYVGLPDALQRGESPSSDEDAELLARAPLWAADTLAHVPGYEPLATVVLYADERWDGAGGVAVSGARIPLASRVAAVARRHRELMSAGTRGPAVDPAGAVATIRDEAGARFDPAVVDALVTLG